MTWDDVKNLISNAAPTLGTVVGSIAGGPAGGVVGGLAGKILKQVFGTDSPEELTQVISQDPNAALKLREAEMAFQLELKKQELEETKTYLADVQSAREREKSIVASTGGKDTNLYVLAWTLVSGFFALTATLMFVPLPEDQSGVIFMLFGALSTGFGSVISYFFGSSKGSADKAKAMEALARNGK